MNLLEALEIELSRKWVISFVGGGGKTSAAMRLARECKTIGMRVLVTTTTKIYIPLSHLYDNIIIHESFDELIKEIKKCGTVLITVAGSKTTEENKIKGIDSSWVDSLYSSDLFDIIIVEADGAKGKPVKAPDLHEPVIPGSTSILTGVCGFDCMGKLIDDQWVHRPHIFCKVVGKNMGDMIDKETILKLSAAENGLFKNCPKGSKKVLLINKVQDMEELFKAKAAAQYIMENNHDLESVLIGSVIDEPPVKYIFKEKVK